MRIYEICLETIIRKCYTVTVGTVVLKGEPSGAKYEEGLIIIPFKSFLSGKMFTFSYSNF